MSNLNSQNYYDRDMNIKYMSAHQFMAFNGTLGRPSCEARAIAELEGKWEEPTTEAMKVGQFVDSYFEGSLNEFKAKHPEIFMKTKGHEGELLAKYRQAETMIERAKQDDYFMSTLGFIRNEDGSFTDIGKKQEIMTAYWAGCEWKIKMDNYIPDVAIVDLKTSSPELHRAWRVPDAGYVSVPEYFGYVYQASVYSKIVEINTGKKLPFYLSFITKEDYPELCVVHIDDTTIQHYQNEIETNMPSILAVKNKEVKPIRCGRCSYCKATAKLKGCIAMEDLINE